MKHIFLFDTVVLRMFSTFISTINHHFNTYNLIGFWCFSVEIMGEINKHNENKQKNMCIEFLT